jgi:hypothetical protein
MLFKGIIAVHFVNYMKHVNTLCEQNNEVFNIKVCDTYSWTASVV